MGIFFVAVVVTGIIKFPGFLRFVGMRNVEISISQISKLHDYTGILMSILVFIHIALNWKWIVVMTKKMFKIKK